jgi:glycosyltransferase involved in cell wall biosynthesis
VPGLGAAAPFLAKDAVCAPSNGRLLLVSYHFPPAETAGALRWQQLSHHALRRGFALDVITRAPARLDAVQSQLDRLPEGIRVFGIPDDRLWIERLEERTACYRQRVRDRFAARREAASPPAGVAQDASRKSSSFGSREVAFDPRSRESWVGLYGAAVIMTRERAWARRAYAVGRSLLGEGTHRLIVSCGPPHWANHEAGRRLARAGALPLVIDLRDPWSLVERLPDSIASPLWLRASARDEARVMCAASLVVMNTEPARDAMRERYPEYTDRIIAVRNGVDDDPLPSAESAGDAATRCVVAYAGTVYLDRNPRNLFRAAARVVRELALTPERFGVAFMGETDPAWIEAIAAEEGITAFVEVRPAGSRAAAAAFLADASVLLNLPQDSHLAVPSKIYEYMRYEAAILALAAPGSATEALLRGADADVVDPNDVDGIAAALERRVREHQQGRRPRALASSERFSRRVQADRLFDAIEDVIAAVRSSGS